MNPTSLDRSFLHQVLMKIRTRIPQMVGLVLLAAFSVVAILSLILGVQSAAWQAYVVSGAALAGIAASLAAIAFSLRSRDELAGLLLIAGTSVIALTCAALYSGLGLPFGMIVLIVILIIAILFMPARSATWAMLVGVGVGIACGLVDLYSTAAQIQISSMGNYLIIAGAGSVALLSGALVLQYRSISLTNKLLVAFLFVTLAAAGVIAFLTAQSSTRALTASIGTLQRSLADAQSKTVGDLVERQIHLLGTLALNDVLQEKVKGANEFYSGDAETIQSKLERFDEQWRAAVAAEDASSALVQSCLGNVSAVDLREFRNEFPDHVEVFFTDRYGGLVGTTDVTSDYYQGDEVWWQKAWNDGKGSIFVGTPELDESAGAVSINMAVPIRDLQTREVIGVLRTTYLLDALRNFVSSIRQDGSGEADLYFPGEPPVLLRDEGDFIELDQETTRILDEVSGFEYSEIDYEGSPVLLSQVSVKPSSDDPVIGALGWRMIVNQELDEALAPVATQTRSILLATMIVVGLVVGASIVLAQVLTRPINHLTAVAARISEGDLEAQAQVESQDEIGVLASTFNAMTQELHTTLEGMEQRVTMRTKELALAGEVSRVLSQELELDQLLKRAVELIQSRFELYYTQIYLYNQAHNSLVLRAGSGTAGAELQQRGHRLPVSQASINGTAALGGRAVVVEDVTQSPNFRSNVLLPETRSEAAIPMRIGERLVGVLDLQSSQVGAFHEDSLPAYEALAGQLAVAVENAAMFAQIQQGRQEIERRVRAQTRLGWEDFLDGIHRNEQVGYVYEDGAVRSADQPEATVEMQGVFQAPIEVSGETIGLLAFGDRGERQYSQDEIELIKGVAAQASRQVENLRLLAQAERYRLEAEETARRLTRQGWEEYQKDLQAQLGFVYDQSQVQADDSDPTAATEVTASYPLVVQDTPIGAVTFEGGMSLGDEDLALVQTVVESLSVHIDNLRLTAQTEVALSNLETLNEVTRSASRMLEFEVVLSEILDRILGVAGFGAGLISIEDLATRRLSLVTHRNLPEAMVTKLTTVGLEGTPCDVVYQSGDTLILSDLEQLPEDLHATNLADDFVRQAMQRPLTMGFHSYLGVALSVKGHVVGTVCLFDQGNKTISPANLELVDSIGQQVGVLVDNARSYQGTQKALAQTEALYNAIAEMNQAESYNDILSALAAHTVLGRADQLLIMGVLDRPLGGEERPHWIYPVAWRSAQPVEVAKRFPAVMMDKVMAGMADENQVTAIGEVDAYSPMMQAVQGLFNLDQPAAGISGIPLTLGGQVIGFVLGLYSQKTVTNAEDVQQLKAVTGQAAIAVESRLLLEQAQAKARQEQRLREVSADVFAAGDVDAILRRAVEQVGRSLGVAAYIYLGQGNGSNGQSLGNGVHDVEGSPEEPELAKM